MFSRREYEKKIREEQEATAHVFQDFISTFQDNSVTPNKTFVKSGVLYPEGDKLVVKTNELYSPKPLIKPKDTTIKNAIECARILKSNKIERSKKQVKPTSNLELLKEELKLRHAERDEKNKNKDDIFSDTYFCEGDPNSTNLFVANLSPKVTENDLMKLFGMYGPLASVKIMWPRGDERFRNTNCGFVAFMSRKDAERALSYLRNRDDMRVGWGKCVDIPVHPIYIPHSLLKLYLPPPYTGLPFNAQPLINDYKIPTNEAEMEELLKNSVVKVTMPLDKKVLMIVHRVIEFVIREGPLFEAYIMNKEIDNPDYSFLFDNKNPVHIYYRWKLYSIQFGQGQKTWTMQPFRMFKGGSIWIPPMTPSYTEGMPEELFTTESATKYKLSIAQVNRLINLIRNLTLSKMSIAEVMVFCLNKSEAIHDILEIITDSLISTTSDTVKKVARLYLLSDILYNCHIKKIKIDICEKIITECLIKFFKNTNQILDGFKCYYDKDAFKTRILKVLRSWDMWRLFPITFIRELESMVLDDDDGNSSNDEPLDGANLIKRSIKNSSVECHVAAPKISQSGIQMKGFVATKWDAVDPEQVEAQAMSTKRLYELEKHNKRKSRERSSKRKNRNLIHNDKNINNKSRSLGIVNSKWDSDDDKDKKSKDTDKELNSKQIKKIEYLVKKYREEIESGSREVKRGYTMRQQVEKYRKQLIRDIMEDNFID